MLKELKELIKEVELITLVLNNKEILNNEHIRIFAEESMKTVLIDRFKNVLIKLFISKTGIKIIQDKSIKYIGVELASKKFKNITLLEKLEEDGLDIIETLKTIKFLLEIYEEKILVAELA